MAYLWPICEESMACSKHGLRALWLESLPLGTIWPVLNDLNGRFMVGFMAWFVKCPWHDQSMV